MNDQQKSKGCRKKRRLSRGIRRPNRQKVGPTWEVRAPKYAFVAGGLARDAIRAVPT